MAEIQTSTQVWQYLIEYIEHTKDFMLEQAPEVIQEVLRYEKIAASLNAITMVILLIVALGAANYFWKHPEFDKYGSRDCISTFGILIPLVAVVPCFVQLFLSIDKLIKIGVAPKYFLMSLILSMKG